jgi:hypothetical protein
MKVLDLPHRSTSMVIAFEDGQLIERCHRDGHRWLEFWGSRARDRRRRGELTLGLIPLSIDGLVVAASMVLLTRRRGGLPGGWRGARWPPVCSHIVGREHSRCRAL